MKLLNVTNRYYIAIALIVVLASNVYILYRVMHFADSETKEHILFEKYILENQLREQFTRIDKKIAFGDLVEIQPIEKMTLAGHIFKDTTLFDASEQCKVPFTELTSQAVINGKPVQLKIRRRLLENEDAIQSVVIPFFISGIFVTLTFFILNSWFSKTKLKPFHYVLSELKKFNPDNTVPLNVMKTDISEFRTLNEELARCTTKVKGDFQNLREFSENISHEIKVPIAVVQGRLEMLLQSPNLASQEKLQINSALDAIHRLMEKNNALSLLSKISSSKYLQTQKINVVIVISQLLEEMADFINYKKIKTRINSENEVWIDANNELIEILFTNLLSNSIKYNIENGDIIINISNKIITISNSGEPLKIPSSEIFERYAKGDHPESTGLGLAIAKKICLLYNYNLGYDYKNGMHVFSCNTGT